MTTKANAIVVKPGTLITDKVTLLALISHYQKTERTRAETLHVLFVSLLVHAAKTGNPDLLNKLFGVLNGNDQRALRFYVDRFQYMTEPGKPGTFLKDAEGNRVASDMAFLEYDRRKGFAVVGGVMANRNRFEEHATNHLLSPSKEYPAFNQINVARETRRDLMGNLDAIKRAQRLVKSIKDQATKDGSPINGKLLAQFEAFGQTIETMAEQFSEDDDASLYVEDDGHTPINPKDVRKAESAIALGMIERLAEIDAEDAANPNLAGQPDANSADPWAPSAWNAVPDVVANAGIKAQETIETSAE